MYKIIDNNTKRDCDIKNKSHYAPYTLKTTEKFHFLFGGQVLMSNDGIADKIYISFDIEVILHF